MVGNINNLSIVDLDGVQHHKVHKEENKCNIDMHKQVVVECLYGVVVS